MKNVIVYRCGKVVADGVELSHVRAVDPPIQDMFGSVTFDITGELTFSPLTYAKAPVAHAPVVTNTVIHDMYRRGKINYGSYRELCAVMGFPAPVPPPAEPEHPDTTRVRKVTERIIALYKEGVVSHMARENLLNLLA